MGKLSTPRGSVRDLSEGDRVQARYYTSNKQSWKLGIIPKKLGRNEGFRPITFLSRHRIYTRFAEKINKNESKDIYKKHYRKV